MVDNNDEVFNILDNGMPGDAAITSSDNTEISQDNGSDYTVSKEPVDSTGELHNEDDSVSGSSTPTNIYKNRTTKKATMKYAYSYVPKSWNGVEEIYGLPGNYDDEVKSQLESLPNINIGDNPESRKWLNVLRKSLSMAPYNNMFSDTINSDESAFTQDVDVNGIKLSPSSPRLKAIENQTIKGESAVLRVVTHLGLGTLFQVPLWHTGMWITFKPPTDAELIELNRILMVDKNILGRYSYGLAYSNIVGYTADRLVDFALAHVFDYTAKTNEISPEQLKSVISSQDIYPLLWGFICTIYPNGFQYQRACTDNPDKCQHVVEERLNLPKLLWVDNSVLTDWQKTHMSSRQSNIKDRASVLRYKEELKSLSKKKVNIGNEGSEIYITITSPSVSEYIDAAQLWISEITQSVEQAISTDATPEEKENLIEAKGMSSSMRQYTQWIESIEFNGNVIEDKETIAATLNVISADDTIRNNFFKEIYDYINKSTISVVGIPKFNCPKCGAVQESEQYPLLTEVIPIDVIQVFFDLITQRLERIGMR